MIDKKIIKITIIFAIFSYVVSFSEQIDQEELALHHFMQGQFLMNQGNYALAILEFQDAIIIDPNISTIHLSIADAYRRLGKIKRSEEHLRISIELDPNEVETLEMLGQLLISKKEFNEARVIFTRLKNLDSDNIDYVFALADLYQIEKEWDLAIDHYIEAFEINNLATNGLEQALQIALTTNKFNRAQEICELLVKEDQANVNLLETMRDICIYNKDYNRTLDIIEKLEYLQGHSPKMSIQKSAIFEELNQPDLALKIMFEVVEKDSQNFEILNRLVTLLINQEMSEKAMLYNQKIIALFPDDPQGFINKAIISMGRKDPLEAISVLIPNSNRFSMNFTFNYLLGTAYYQMKDFINSKIYLLQALSIYPQSRNTKHNLALIYDSTEDWEESDKIYMELIASDSTDAQAYNNYAYSLAERNQNVQFALELAQNAIRLEPKSAPYLDTVGWIYFKLENYDEALKYIKESLSIDTENSTIQDHLNQVIKKKAQTNKPNIQQVKNRD